VIKARETLEHYCRLAGHQWPAASPITAYRLQGATGGTETFAHIRRDFYKIKLLRQAHGVLHYGNQQVAVQGDALLFVNPQLPYSWQQAGAPYTGYACLFTEQFVTPHLKTASMAHSPLFSVGAVPVLPVPAAVADHLSQLFERLVKELHSDYAGRYEVASSYLHLVLHEALRLWPAPVAVPGTAATRLSARFLALLERQFPVASPQRGLALRTAGEYARHLAVHPNHLNKALQATTGKTTTEHLASRLADEARALLHHSDWSPAEIGYCLGFEHPANFAAFFKKQTGQPPASYRRQAVVVS
jgi:AraC family transcriptional activator of pobA